MLLNSISRQEAFAKTLSLLYILLLRYEIELIARNMEIERGNIFKGYSFKFFFKVNNLEFFFFL